MSHIITYTLFLYPNNCPSIEFDKKYIEDKFPARCEIYPCDIMICKSNFGGIRWQAFEKFHARQILERHSNTSNWREVFPPPDLDRYEKDNMHYKLKQYIKNTCNTMLEYVDNLVDNEIEEEVKRRLKLKAAVKNNAEKIMTQQNNAIACIPENEVE